MNTDILLSYLLYPGERLGGFVPTAGLLVPLGFGPSVGALVFDPDAIWGPTFTCPDHRSKSVDCCCSGAVSCLLFGRTFSYLADICCDIDETSVA